MKLGKMYRLRNGARVQHILDHEHWRRPMLLLDTIEDDRVEGGVVHAGEILNLFGADPDPFTWRGEAWGLKYDVVTEEP